jgi:hypothetical protein
MAVKYVLRKNALMENPDAYTAIVKTTGSAGLDEITDRIVSQGTTVRRADVLAVLENTLTACDSMLQDGMRVQLGGLVDLFPKISGTFDGACDTYDPARHQVDIAAMAGKRLRNSFRSNAAIAKSAASKLAPSPAMFSQTPAPQQSSQIVAGSIGTIDGWHLKFNPSQIDEGIYFVRMADSVDFKIEAINSNTPKKLVFLTPTLPAGSYKIEVRCRIRGGKELRSGWLDEELFV